MKALSLRQPWAAAVLHLGKRIENRTWPTSFRGEFLIHAAKAMTRREYDDAIDWCSDAIGINGPITDSLRVEETLAHDKLLFGGIVGKARLVAIVPPRPEFVTAGVETWYPARARDCWRWHMREQWGFILEDIQATPFVPCTGSLGFFDVGEDIVQRALARVSA